MSTTPTLHQVMVSLLMLTSCTDSMTGTCPCLLLIESNPSQWVHCTAFHQLELQLQVGLVLYSFQGRGWHWHLLTQCISSAVTQYMAYILTTETVQAWQLSFQLHKYTCQELLFISFLNSILHILIKIYLNFLSVYMGTYIHTHLYIIYIYNKDCVFCIIKICSTRAFCNYSIKTWTNNNNKLNVHLSY